MMWNRTPAERGQVFPCIFCCAACQSLKPGTAGLWFTSKSCSHMPRVAAMSTFHILNLTGFCCCPWEITGDDTGSMKMLAVSFVGHSELWRPFNVCEKLKHNGTVVVIFIQGCSVHVKKQEFQPAREHVLKGQGPRRWRSRWQTHSSKPTSHANMAPVTSAPVKWQECIKIWKRYLAQSKQDYTKQHRKSHQNIPKSQFLNHPSIVWSIHSSIDSCMVDVPVGPHVRQGTRSSDLNQRNRFFTNKSLEVFFFEGFPEFHLDCLSYYWSRRRGWNMGEIVKTLSENRAARWDFVTFIRTKSATASLFHFKTSSNLANFFTCLYRLETLQLRSKCYMCIIFFWIHMFYSPFGTLDCCDSQHARTNATTKPLHHQADKRGTHRAGSHQEQRGSVIFNEVPRGTIDVQTARMRWKI